MDSHLLPKQSFIPRGMHNAHDRRMFAERRDLLFSVCTPAEQTCLHALAGWYESYWFELIAKPNLLDRCLEADFYLRYQLLPGGPKMPPLQRAFIKWVASVGRGVVTLETGIGNWQQMRFVSFLRSSVKKGEEDVLIGVIDFLRFLPLQVGKIAEQRSLQALLENTVQRCLASDNVSARQRMDAVIRCIDRAYAPGMYVLPDSVNTLRKQAWPLLLELANEDIQAALRIVDEQSLRKGKANAFSNSDLHETPELSYQLAKALRPHRVVFAAEMLRESIQHASFRRSGLKGEPAIALSQVMDASCRLLAEWVVPAADMPDEEVLRSVHRLLWYGNPEDAYWMTLPEQALAIVRRLPLPERRSHLPLIVQVAFYGGQSASAQEAHAMFDESVATILGVMKLSDWDRRQDSDDLMSIVGGTVFELSRCLSIVEDKSGSMRNAHVSACPDHNLVRTFETRVDAFVKQLFSDEPENALFQLARVTVHMKHERLFLKYHKVLREEFAARVEMYPEDAGHALKTVIKSCAYSQSDDEMYRKDVCRDTFDSLLPLLDAISPQAAGHARTGIGWNLRGNI